MSKEEKPIICPLNIEDPDFEFGGPVNLDARKVEDKWSPIRSPIDDCCSGTAKDDNNGAGPSGTKCSEPSANSPGVKTEVKEHSGSEIAKDDKNVAGPSGINSPKTDEQDEEVDIMTVDDTDGLTQAQILIAQIEEEKRKKEEEAAERQRQRQREAQTSSSSTNSPKRPRLD